MSHQKLKRKAVKFTAASAPTLSLVLTDSSLLQNKTIIEPYLSLSSLWRPVLVAPVWDVEAGAGRCTRNRFIKIKTFFSLSWKMAIPSVVSFRIDRVLSVVFLLHTLLRPSLGLFRQRIHHAPPTSLSSSINWCFLGQPNRV